MSESIWFVYIIRCADGTLYCGIATDVARRIGEHEEGAPKGAKYTRGKGPLELVFQKEIGSRSDASKEELRIKGLSKKEKLLMLEAFKSPSVLADSMLPPQSWPDPRTDKDP